MNIETLRKQLLVTEDPNTRKEIMKKVGGRTL